MHREIMENSMVEQLRTRLAELKEEFERGQKKLVELDTEANNLRQALLRISGAVQVLEEEISKAEAGKK
jgi:hypothetical protein